MSIRIFVLTATAASLLTLGGCDVVKSSSTPATPKRPSVAATVNGTNIAESQLETIFKQNGAEAMINDEALRARVIDQLAVQLIAAKEAAKKGLDKEAETKEQLEMARQSILATALVMDYVKKNPVTSDEINKEYEKLKASMNGKEFKARHILVKQEAEAKSLIAKLQANPKSFEALAKEKSIDPGSKANGGDLGWFDPGQMVPEFSAALNALQKDQITQEPVKTQFGYHIIQLEDSRDRQFPPVEDVSAKLEEQLQQKKLAAFLEDMKAKAKISITKLPGADKPAPTPPAAAK